MAAMPAAPAGPDSSYLMENEVKFLMDRMGLLHQRMLATAPDVSRPDEEAAAMNTQEANELTRKLHDKVMAFAVNDHAQKEQIVALQLRAEVAEARVSKLEADASIAAAKYANRDQAYKGIHESLLKTHDVVGSMVRSMAVHTTKIRGAVIALASEPAQEEMKAACALKMQVMMKTKTKKKATAKKKKENKNNGTAKKTNKNVRAKAAKKRKSSFIDDEAAQGSSGSDEDEDEEEDDVEDDVEEKEEDGDEEEEEDMINSDMSSVADSTYGLGPAKPVKAANFVAGKRGVDFVGDDYPGGVNEEMVASFLADTPTGRPNTVANFFELRLRASPWHADEAQVKSFLEHFTEMRTVQGKQVRVVLSGKAVASFTRGQLGITSESEPAYAQCVDALVRVRDTLRMRVRALMQDPSSNLRRAADQLDCMT